MNTLFKKLCLRGEIRGKGGQNGSRRYSSLALPELCSSSSVLVARATAAMPKCCEEEFTGQRSAKGRDSEVRQRSTSGASRRSGKLATRSRLASCSLTFQDTPRTRSSELERARMAAYSYDETGAYNVSVTPRAFALTTSLLTSPSPVVHSLFLPLPPLSLALLRTRRVRLLACPVLSHHFPHLPPLPLDLLCSVPFRQW